MQSVFFVSDNHFFHKKIREFCPDTRQGTSVEEMNELMIDKWNDTVALCDQVYCLGDLFFGSNSQAENVFRRLKGQIFLIRGNHDNWLDNKKLHNYFEWIGDYKTIKIDKQKIVMFHYPIWEWQDMHKGAYHLFGHVHGNSVVPGRAMDVGIDARPQKDMGLWSWEEVNAILSTREIRSHHNKYEGDE